MTFEVKAAVLAVVVSIGLDVKAAVLEDGDVVAASEGERKKHRQHNKK
jgi:hypothetical protein